ncbi:SRPBCC family protein [Pseudooceanicola sp. HF7]|uniref:SRPBCC family protein n=1 Tax=Pseudooceanicola sp. HF7 TaxID=2721560 RepID=UPI00142F432C|nr:SRPBCC family protein [Pseudooceanicola sp. HF7]NIZ11508.1 SRPBCC family protein [Pseudooceanicola sp. HF7]
MKVVAKEDIEAPIQTVFTRLTDFRTFERSAIRRGASVKRIDGFDVPAKGVGWEVQFSLRGKRRDLQLEVVRFDPPEGLEISANSQGMRGQVIVQLVALSPTRTRLRIETEVKPQTLSARLLIQSLRLARANVHQRMQDRLAEFAASIEGRRPPRRV